MKIERGESPTQLREVHESIKRLLPFWADKETRYVLDGSGQVRIERHNWSSFSSSIANRSDLKTMYIKMGK